MLEILNYILLGIQITTMLMCCYLCGLHIGDFIFNKKIEKLDIVSPPVRIEDMHLRTMITNQEPYRKASMIVEIVFDIGEYQLFDGATGDHYEMYLPDTNLKVEDIVYIEFYPGYIRYYTE